MNLDNVNAYNTSAFKLDDNASYMSGSMSMQRSDGTTLTGYDDGSTAINTAHSGPNMNTRITASDVYSSGSEEILSNYRETVGNIQGNYLEAKVEQAQSMYEYGKQLRAKADEDGGYNFLPNSERADAKNIIDYTNYIDNLTDNPNAGFWNNFKGQAHGSFNLGVVSGGLSKDIDNTPVSVFEEKLNSATTSFSRMEKSGDEGLEKAYSIANDSISSVTETRSAMQNQLHEANREMTAMTVQLSTALEGKTDMTQAAIDSLKTKINPKTGKPFTDNDIATLDKREAGLLQAMLKEEAVALTGIKKTSDKPGDDDSSKANESDRKDSSADEKMSKRNQMLERMVYDTKQS